MAGSSAIRQSVAISSDPVKRAGRETIWIANAHRDDGKRFVVRADEKLTAFLELERAIHHFAVSLLS